MVLHGIALVICFIGLVVLSMMGEHGAFRQLMYFVFCLFLAITLGIGMLSLLFG